MFNMHPSRITRRPQARAEATKTRILDAAQSLFAELGFENTQLDEVAARAGCSRGGIYAHYASKEGLFLALMEHRVSATFRAACKKIEEEPDLKERRNIFKRWLVEQICGPESGTLTLEFKLYAVRRPERRDELLRLYNALFTGTDGISIDLLFGKKLTKTARIAMEQRIAVLGGALSALILERHFRPALLTPSHLQPLAEEIFDALLHT
jgi:AcrR family transcriptional regulator